MILHPQLQKDCFIIAEFELSLLLLLNDRQYPWFILVPQRENLSEIHHLSGKEQEQFIFESCQLSKMIETMFKVDKINVAALGNMVPQLHVHHIGRFKTDKAWPKPVWGMFPAQPYPADEVAAIAQRVYQYFPSITKHYGEQ